MVSTERGGSTPPTLTEKCKTILFCAGPHPFYRGNWKGDVIVIVGRGGGVVGIVGVGVGVGVGVAVVVVVVVVASKFQ